MDKVKLMIEFLNVLNQTKMCLVPGFNLDEIREQTINQIKVELGIGDKLFTKKEILEQLR